MTEQMIPVYSIITFILLAVISPPTRLQECMKSTAVDCAVVHKKWVVDRLVKCLNSFISYIVKILFGSDLPLPCSDFNSRRCT